MSNNFALMLRVRGEISAGQLATALRQVRVRHPALLPEPTDFPFEVRAGCGDDDWIEAAGSELRRPFPERGGPLARFTLLQRAGGFDLLAAFHHGAADGMSGVFVLRDLLQALADPQATLVPLPAPPPAGALIPAAVLADRGLHSRVALAVAALRARLLLARLRRRLSAPRPVGVAPAAPLPAGELPPDRQYLILPARLTIPQTAALLARCKQEQVTVHAAVCVAWLRAQAALTGARSGIVSSPVNLRDRLARPVGETSGVFLATLETRLECAPGRDFWDLAREFKQKLDRDLRDEVLFFKPLLYSQLFPRVPAADRGLLAGMLFNSPVTYDFSITNLGRLALPLRSGALRVEAFYGPLVNSSEYERTVGVSTFADRLGLSFVFRASRTDPAQAKELMQRALALLTEPAAT